MAPIQAILRLISVFLWFRCCVAWYIDNSCSTFIGPGQTYSRFEIVRKATSSAAAMVIQTKNEMEKFGSLMDENSDVKDLATYIFGSNDQQGWIPAREYYRALASDAVSSSTTPSVSPDGIKIYCSLSRWEVKTMMVNNAPVRRSKDKDNSDATTEVILDADIPVECSGTARALTYSNPSRVESYIQICPQIVQKWNSRPLPLLQDFVDKLISDTGSGKLGQGIRIPLGDVVRLEKTMLHEFFHTYYASAQKDYSRRAIDTKDKLGKPICYGWTNIKRLGEQGIGMNNADSLAYFGFGVKLILDYGWIVNDDGTMSDHPLSPRRWPIDAVLGAAGEGLL